MTLLKQCFCYSLRQGSFLIGAYSLIVYCLAFAVELWWIVEALLILPAPAYTLCALYFFNFVMAALLLFGLLIRQRKYLLGWSLMTVLSFFPECGMVLFMSLYYWPTHKYEYGVIELVYWSLRAIFNIFGALCVISLYLCWRDEELILSRLHDLTLASVESGSTGAGGGLVVNQRYLQRVPVTANGVLKSHSNGFGNGTLKHTFAQHPRTNNTNTNTYGRKLRYPAPAHHRHTTPNYNGYRNYGYMDSAGSQFQHRQTPTITRDFYRGSDNKNSLHRLQNGKNFRSSFHQPTLPRHNRQLSFFAQPPSRSISTAAIHNLYNNDNNNSIRKSNNLSLYSNQYNSFTMSATLRNAQRAQTHANLSSTTLKKNEFNPAIIFDPSYKYKSRISDWGIAGIGLEPPGQLPPLSMPLHRTHSLWHVSNDEYWTRPPPSRPVSMGYVNHAYHTANDSQIKSQPSYYAWNEDDKDPYEGNWSPCTPRATLSKNRKSPSKDANKNWLTIPKSSIMTRKATSVDGLHRLNQSRFYGQNILANSGNFTMMKSNQLGVQNVWNKSSSDQDENEYRGIEDDDEGDYQNYHREFIL